MSHQAFVDFLRAVREDPALLEVYNRRNLSQLLFHAKNDGFDFTADDITDVVSALEPAVILDKDGDQISADSRLWRQMWGRPHLEYVVDRVVARFGDEELRALVAAAATKETV